MLANDCLFEHIEESLEEEGTMQAWVQEKGPVVGHMMITSTDVPWDLSHQKNNTYQAFMGTFDFLDMGICIVLDTDTKEITNDVWMVPQKEEAEVPSIGWIRFFSEVVRQKYIEDGSINEPLCTFIWDKNTFRTVCL